MIRLALVLLLVAGPAFGHAGEGPHETLPWSWDATITAPLGAVALLYGAGIARLWSQAGIGRGAPRRQVLLFAAGWLVLALSLVSPLHALGERLFTAHMIEHELLMAVAAPLLVLSRPVGPMIWALPRVWRRTVAAPVRRRPLAAVWRAASSPLGATLLHGIAIWIWHVPALFAAAVTNEAVHWAQHASFLFTALLFWWAIFRRGRSGIAIGHLFATAMHTGLLGALLTVAPRLWFPDTADEALHWGLTPLEDQQLAGIVMWIPAGLVYAGAALVLAGFWIARSAPAGRFTLEEPP